MSNIWRCEMRDWRVDTIKNLSIKRFFAFLLLTATGQVFSAETEPKLMYYTDQYIPYNWCSEPTACIGKIVAELQRQFNQAYGPSYTASYSISKTYPSEQKLNGRVRYFNVEDTYPQT
ncbi:MAG: hypothetical protein ACOVOD_01610 [Rhodoferax sp.]